MLGLGRVEWEGWASWRRDARDFWDGVGVGVGVGVSAGMADIVGVGILVGLGVGG